MTHNEAHYCCHLHSLCSTNHNTPTCMQANDVGTLLLSVGREREREREDNHHDCASSYELQRASKVHTSRYCIEQCWLVSVDDPHLKKSLLQHTACHSSVTTVTINSIKQDLPHSGRHGEPLLGHPQ
jgi:hypothetical protein